MTRRITATIGRKTLAGGAAVKAAPPPAILLTGDQRRFGGLILMMAYCIGLCAAAFGQSASPSAATVLEALQEGNNVEALRLSAQLLRAEPKSSKLWALRGTALERTNRPTEALKAYQEALKYAPDYLPALEGAAQLEYKAQSKDALPLLRRIVVLKPTEATAHAMLGVMEYREREYGKAVQDFAAAGDLLRSQPSAWTDYGLSLAQLNRDSEAMEVFAQLQALRPEDAAVRYDLALLHWRSAKSADALATLQPLLDARPPDVSAMRLAAAIHEANGETPKAVELLRSAILADPEEAGSYLDFAQLSFAHGSYTVGIDIINAGLTRLPRSAALYMARGVLYGQNGEFENAMADFERAHTIDPNNSMAASAEGIAHSQQHNNKEALEQFRNQVGEHPNDAFGYYLLAEALSWTGPEDAATDHQKNVAEAIATAEKAAKLDPKLLEAHDLLSSLYLQNDQVQAAIAACRAALKLNPKDQSALYTLILALRKTDSKDELKTLLARLTELRKEETQNQHSRYGMLVEER